MQVEEELAVARQRLFRLEIPLEKPVDAPEYSQYARDVIKSILVRLSTMHGLRKETITGFVSDFKNGKLHVCITAVGDSSREYPFPKLQQEFVLHCYNGQFPNSSAVLEAS